MEALCSTDIFLFEGFRLDRRGLFRRCEDAALAPVEIGSRALEVLRVLLRRPGELLLRHEIMAAAWPSTVVGDNNLNVQISALRRVLDQDCASGSCIQTIPGCGYRFVAPVKWLEANPHSPFRQFPTAASLRRADCRSSCCRSPMSATIQRNILILSMALPKI